jgi:hypothetical protein
MPTADYSSSRLTNLRNSITLANYRRANNTAVASGASVLREQSSMPLNAIVVARNQTSANQLAAAGEECSCVKPVFTNPGGC